MSNRDRILEAAHRLMNAQGAQAIGTKQITDDTGISPGNLYYHFRNREEIVRALFNTLDQEFRATLVADLNPPISPRRFAGFYLDSFTIAWKHRYFFGSALYLLRNDPILAEHYRKLQTWSLDNLEQIAKQLCRDGNMDRPKGPNGYRSLALNTWLIWSNWVRHLQLTAADHSVTRKDMQDGVMQIFDVMSPYLDERFDKEARRDCARQVRAA